MTFDQWKRAVKALLPKRIFLLPGNNTLQVMFEKGMTPKQAAETIQKS